MQWKQSCWLSIRECEYWLHVIVRKAGKDLWLCMTVKRSSSNTRRTCSLEVFPSIRSLISVKRDLCVHSPAAALPKHSFSPFYSHAGWEPGRLVHHGGPDWRSAGQHFDLSNSWPDCTNANDPPIIQDVLSLLLIWKTKARRYTCMLSSSLWSRRHDNVSI